LQGKELQVGNKRVRQYEQAFREIAVGRMKGCDNVAGLARDLGVHRSVLYQWRDRLGAHPERATGSLVERENERLKQALAEKTLEADFFRSALQKVEARRQNNSTSGGTASTTRSES
jgi:transposase-like protein